MTSRNSRDMSARALLREAAPYIESFAGMTKHPSVSRVVTTNTIMAALHWMFGAWLDRRAERAMARDSDKVGLLFVGRLSYYGVSIGGTGSAVAGNVMNGVRPLAGGTCP